MSAGVADSASYNPRARGDPCVPLTLALSPADGGEGNFGIRSAAQSVRSQRRESGAGEESLPPPYPRNFRTSPTRSVTFSASKYSASGMAYLRDCCVSCLNSCAVIWPRARKKSRSKARRPATAS